MTKLDVGDVSECVTTTVEDNVEDAHGAPDRVLIRSLGYGEDGGFGLISLEETFTSNIWTKTECKVDVLRKDDLVWDMTIGQMGCAYAVCGGIMYLVGGMILDYKAKTKRANNISDEMHFINLLEKRPCWMKGPSMSVGRYGHTAVSFDDKKIYVFGGRKGEYAGYNRIEWSLPFAEVYDIEEKRWSSVESPFWLSVNSSSFIRSCVVDVDGKGKKKILVSNGTFYCYLYDPDSGEWEEYDEMWRRYILAEDVSNMFQSGRLLFFICGYVWWVFDLDSKKMWEHMGGLDEAIEKLELPEKDCFLVGVVGMGCSEYQHPERGLMNIHDFVTFFKAEESTTYVARIGVAEIRPECFCYAEAWDGVRKLKWEGFRWWGHYFYAAIAPQDKEEGRKSVESHSVSTSTGGN